MINEFTDAQVAQWMSGKSDAEVARQAASMGLNAGQIQQAYQLSGKNYTANDINGYAQNNGYSWGSNGGLINSQAAPAAAPAQQTGGIYVQGKYYSPQQIKDFYAGGGNDAQFAQQAGMTDQGQIHDLAVQARGIAGEVGGYASTGDAALKNQYAQYLKYNPNGAGVSGYQGWIDNQSPNAINAMRAGTYTGAANDQRDWEPGGIYQGSLSGVDWRSAGLGARGMNEGWTTGAINDKTSKSIPNNGAQFDTMFPQYLPQYQNRGGYQAQPDRGRMQPSPSTNGAGRTGYWDFSNGRGWQSSPSSQYTSPTQAAAAQRYSYGSWPSTSSGSGVVGTGSSYGPAPSNFNPSDAMYGDFSNGW